MSERKMMEKKLNAEEFKELFMKDLHNAAFDVNMALQTLEEKFKILCPELMMHDKATIAYHQIRVMRSEARHLTRAMSDLSHFLFYKSPEKQEESEPEPAPENLDEAIQFLIDAYEKGDSGWDDFKSMDEESAICAAHHGTGQNMRNGWGLWADSPLAKWFNNAGIHHADDMSSIILTSFHRKLNGKEIKLDEQIKYYQDYWEKHQLDKRIERTMKEA